MDYGVGDQLRDGQYDEPRHRLRNTAPPQERPGYAPHLPDLREVGEKGRLTGMGCRRYLCPRPCAGLIFLNRPDA
ncbi:hypothetical protein GCM10018771_46870 [Streptomyces cellulosae]|nr:hypothetical protein GCM10018771_46870 [Streptomyces cellulosae]